MTVVVAYADTEPGRAAVRAALEQGKEGEPLVLVPAVRGAEPPDAAALMDAWGGPAVLVEVERGDLGDPSDAVVQVAQRRDARLIVLGLRHRTPVGKALFGSTAQRILLDATCPVLAVKPDQGP